MAPWKTYRTRFLSKKTGKLIQVDSIDGERDYNLDIFIVPQHVVTVRIEKSGDRLEAVA